MTPARYKDSSFENFKIRKPVDQEVVDTLKSEIKENVIILGAVGVGKTHLAWALYNSTKEVIEVRGEDVELNRKVKIVTVKEVVDNIKASWKGKASNLDDYKNIPILVIDEIGVQYGSESERIELFEIFNHRYNEMLPTIALSNLDDKRIKVALGLRIYDRLFGGASV